jgi:hypothetical protein
MVKSVKIGDIDYDLDSLSSDAKVKVSSIQFIDQQVRELTNMQALLQRAKKSYIESLKLEMLSDKAGFLFSDD